MDSNETYYQSLKRRFTKAEKDWWDHPDDSKHKDGEEILLEENPANPDEMRQFVEVMCAYENDIDSSEIPKLYNNALNLIESMERSYPGDEDLAIARRKLNRFKMIIWKGKSLHIFRIAVIIGIVAIVIRLFLK